MLMSEQTDSSDIQERNARAGNNHELIKNFWESVLPSLTQKQAAGRDDAKRLHPAMYTGLDELSSLTLGDGARVKFRPCLAVSFDDSNAEEPHCSFAVSMENVDQTSFEQALAAIQAALGNSEGNDVQEEFLSLGRQVRSRVSDLEREINRLAREVAGENDASKIESLEGGEAARTRTLSAFIPDTALAC